jgi:hypothetical protein
MKKARILGLLITLLCLSFLVFERKELTRARSEIVRLKQETEALSAEKERLSSEAMNQENSRSLMENEKGELLKLRGEVNRLRQEATEAEKAKGMASVQTPAVPDSPATPPRVAFGTELRDMGAATPERAASSLIWAASSGRKDRIMELVDLPANTSEGDAARLYEHITKNFGNRFSEIEFVSVQSIRPNPDGTLRINQTYRDNAGKTWPFPFMMRLHETGWKVVFEE